jgi:hypothetical protein
MTNLETELMHLVNLMAPPYTEQWKAYSWAKAKALARSNPEDYAELPQMLAAAMKSSSSAESGTPGANS